MPGARSCSAAPVRELVGTAWARESGVRPKRLVPEPRPEPGIHERPSVAARDPEREADSKAVSAWFARWLDDNRISIRDLATILDVTIAVAWKKRRGESPLSFVDLKRIQKRYRRELAFAFLLWCDESDLNSKPHG
jgi:hypothetical protein